MKILRYIIFAAAAVMMASCSLDEKNFTEKNQDLYINNATEANTVLMGVYRNMVLDGMYGYHLSLYFTLPSDEAKVEGNSTDNFRNVPNNNYTSTENEVEETWAALYQSIYYANDFIERLAARVQTFPESQRDLAAVYMAEARALRAMFYFELVRWYGNVVLMTSTEQSQQDPTTFTQAAPVEVYQFIEKELLYAVDNLPYANDDAYRTDNAFRFSKGAALGLLTKVYATWAGAPLNDESKWEAAAKTAKTLIQSGNHGLLEDFNQLWVNSSSSAWDPTESLIEVSFYSPVMTGTNANDPSGRIGKWNGVSAAENTLSTGRCSANWKVVPTFAMNWWKSMTSGQVDKRFDISIADHKYTAKVPAGIQILDGQLKGGTFQDAINAEEKNLDKYRKPFNNDLYPGKWDMGKYTSDNQVTDANKSNINWYILRYADVLLLYAEALNEWQQGPTNDAYAAINMVRRRAYGFPLSGTSKADLATGLSYEAFRQAVREERAYELAFEGHRRQDLIRWGIFYETIRGTYSDLSSWHEMAPDYYRAVDFTIKGKNELLPIPQRDVDISGFRQNPGW